MMPAGRTFSTTLLSRQLLGVQPGLICLVLSGLGMMLSPAVAQRSEAPAGNQFELIVPGDEEDSSRAVFDGRSLLIQDSRGRKFEYVRAPQFDTPDGEFSGWFSPAARQAIRWPANNRGSMLIGDATGNQWKQSQMRIVPVQRAARPVTPLPPAPGIGPRGNEAVIPRRLPERPATDLFPGMDRDRNRSNTGAANRRRARRHRSMELYPTVVESNRGQLAAGFIDSEGKLQLVQGESDRWRSVPRVWQGQLEPGGVLRAVPDAISRGNAAFCTIDSRGDLLLIRLDGTADYLTDNGHFVPGGDLQIAGLRQPWIVTIDSSGVLVAVDLQTGREQVIDDFRTDQRGGELRPQPRDSDRISDLFRSRDNRNQPGDRSPAAPLRSANRRGNALPAGGQPSRGAVPGGPLAVPHAATGERHGLDVFLVNRAGELVQYERVRGGWAAPQLVARGFVPGTSVSAVSLALPGAGAGNDGLAVVAADVEGTIRLLTSEGRGWRSAPAPRDVFPALSSLELVNGPRGLWLSGVPRSGDWMVWELSNGRRWLPHVIASGFPAGAPVAFLPDALTGLCVDLTGRLVAGYQNRSGWDAVLCRPGFDNSPRLTRRSIVAGGGGGLPPAQITFSNPSNETLLVRLYDRVQGQQVAQLRLPARGSATRLLERDGGTVLEEVWLVPGPGGQLVEEVHRHTLPGRIRYDVVVFADRTTYQYIDRRKDKPEGALEDFSINSLVSLGAFPLPAGRGLQDGDRIDVPYEAAIRDNPGAPVLFP